MTTVSDPISAIPKPNIQTVVVWAIVFALEFGLVLAYVSVRGAQLMLFHLYPFVWLNLGVWAVWKTDPVPASRLHGFVAGAIATGYFLVLGYFGGLFAEGHVYHDHHAHSEHAADFIYGFEIATVVPPGYGPAIFYSHPQLNVALSPYMLIGYLALAYLLYSTLLEVASAAAPGTLGLFTCIGCSWPLLAAVTTGSAGATSAVASAVYANSYALSTVAFVGTVLLLYWRPFHTYRQRTIDV